MSTFASVFVAVAARDLDDRVIVEPTSGSISEKCESDPTWVVKDFLRLLVKSPQCAAVNEWRQSLIDGSPTAKPAVQADCADTFGATSIYGGWYTP